MMIIPSKNSIHTVYKDNQGNKVVGTTTVIGQLSKPALIHWAWTLGKEGKDYRKIRDSKADIGTLAHAMVLAHLTNDTVDTSEYSKNEISLAENSLISFYSWIDKYKIEPIKCEYKMVDSDLKYGGTCDVYCKLDGKLTLLDLKTGKIWPEHLHQLSAYRALLIKHNCNIEQVICLSIPRDENDSFEKKVYTDKQLDLGWIVFEALLKVYYGRKQLEKEEK